MLTEEQSDCSSAGHDTLHLNIARVLFAAQAVLPET